MPSPKCARRSISAATTRRRRGARSRRRRCPARPARANELRYRGRGVFVCISPWNFPLAIFLGQVTAALAAGNAVVAKPAEQTPLIAAEAVRLFAPRRHSGDGAASRARRRHGRRAPWSPIRASPASPSPARPRSAAAINRTLAAKDGPIVPLIAETGGINAMIVDATALPEQVTDDVVTSAFRSAGQRCSALRLLCVQDDVADRMIDMVAGAARELQLGDPREPSHPCRPGDRCRGQGEARPLDRRHGARRAASFPLGPVRHHAGARHLMCRRPSSSSTAPRDLTEEVFGPVLHVVRWRADELDALIDDIARDRLRPHARHPFAHRRDRRARSRRGSRTAMSMSTAT